MYAGLSRAFDLINHSVLVKKLENYGIRGTGLKLLESYLGYRKQFVSKNNHNSATKRIVNGVPRGLYLGRCCL